MKKPEVLDLSIKIMGFYVGVEAILLLKQLFLIKQIMDGGLSRWQVTGMVLLALALMVIIFIISYLMINKSQLIVKLFVMFIG